MKISKEIKKEKAIELMQKLDIYKPYIKGFKEKSDVCFFEEFGGFWAYQEPDLISKIRDFEERHNVLVYTRKINKKQVPFFIALQKLGHL